MNNGLNAIGPNATKTPVRCNIGDNNKVELALRDILVNGTNCLPFLLRPDGCDDGVASLEKRINHMAGDETRTA